MTNGEILTETLTNSKLKPCPFCSDIYVCRYYIENENIDGCSALLYIKKKDNLDCPANKEEVNLYLCQK